MSKQKNTQVSEKKVSAAAAVAPQNAVRPEVTQEQIARRAYELFLARGGEHGRHEQDWVQAERELRLGRQ